MAKLKTTRWDPAKHLATTADIAAYLDAAIEDGDPALISAALGDIARAKGMAQLAEKVGMSRTSLYKALSAEGRPEFATVLKVLNALGLQLRAEPRSAKKRAKKAA
ncbi:MAG TPA: addiction module antidote protein [Dongiaceae bacterium]|nr:addiction module antidote protein [Dongiaceae bacterium]